MCSSHPVIGLAPRNPDYRLVVEGCSHVNDFKGCVEEAGPGLGPMTTMKMSVRKRHLKGQGSPYLRDALKKINSIDQRALQKARGEVGEFDVCVYVDMCIYV